MRRQDLVSLSIAALVVLSVSACSQHHYANRFKTQNVKITGARGDGPRSQLTQFLVQLDNCSGKGSQAYGVTIVENSHSVRVNVTGPVWQGKGQASCIDGAPVTLTHALGGRRIIDASTHHEVTLTPSAAG